MPTGLRAHPPPGPPPLRRRRAPKNSQYFPEVIACLQYAQTERSPRTYGRKRSVVIHYCTNLLTDSMRPYMPRRLGADVVRCSLRHSHVDYLRKLGK
jgi:hypothetical protein